MRGRIGILILLLVGCDGAAPLDGSTAEVCAEDVDCDDGRFCNGAERCVGIAASPSADARGCAPAEGAVCEGEALDCYELESRCRTRCDITEDADGDGVASMDCGGADCDDTDPGAFPGNLETCDFVGHDEDCDPTTFGSDRDIDGDGEPDAACINGPRDAPVSRGTDCDDRRAYVAPGQPEVCNGLDDDCDGTLDEGVTVPRYRDGDGDGDGDAMGATVEVCPDATGYSDQNTDCDDSTPLYRGSPWFELCDGEDNDCDGTTDENPRAVAWYVDADRDGFGDPEAPVVISCAPVRDRSLLGTDCDDSLAGVRPGNPELCNGLDDDCNGRLDYRDARISEDEDGDGVPNRECFAGGDCDDRDFLAGGDAPEICGDLADNDCDGMVDEAGAVPIEWYADRDGDGWGDRDSGAVATQCERLPRASFRVADCDDSDPLRHPFAVDLCDGRDDDCDLAFDEDAPRRVVFRDADGDGLGVETEVLLVCGPTAPAGYADVPRDCAPGDPAIGLRWADADGDGVGGGEPLLMCTGGVAVGGDCNDSEPTIQTGCQELCNGVDDDGDARIDETGGMGCPNASGTMWTCSAGSCVFGGCSGTGTDCDAISTNGCEAELETDPDNCGMCAAPCGIGAGCAARACTSTVIDVEVGGIASCALRDNGRVVCWGRLPTDLRPPVDTQEPRRDTLLLEAGALVEDASWLEVGRNAWCIGRASDGVVRCAADSADSSFTALRGTRPADLGPVMPAGMTELDLGGRHACAISSTGLVLCWGSNAEGQLGRGFASTRETTPAPALGISGVSRVAVGDLHSCAIAGTSVYCWGMASGGRIGTPSIADALTPVIVPMTNAAGDPPIDVACANSSTCVLRMSGAVECTGSFTSFPTVTQLTPIGTVPGATQIHGAAFHYCVQSPTGAYCFGSDVNARLGNGPGRMDSSTPVLVPGLGNVVALDVAVDHSCAVTTTGEVYCWGTGSNGRLGARVTQSDVPIRVLNLP